MSDDLEREKLQVEREKLAAESARSDRDHKQRVVEQEFREAESRRSRWAHPLVLAVFAAAAAAAGNAYVAWKNGETQLQIASQNHTRDVNLDEKRAEAALMLEMIKSGDACKAAHNLYMAFESGLVLSQAKRDALSTWMNGGNSKSGCTKAAAVANPPPEVVAAPTPPPVIEQFETGWLGGGNTQTQQCDIGRATLAQKHAPKRIQLLRSWEESKRDFLGHVEYKYFCAFLVG